MGDDDCAILGNGEWRLNRPSLVRLCGIKVDDASTQCFKGGEGVGFELEFQSISWKFEIASGKLRMS